MKKYLKYLKIGTVAGVAMAMVEMIYEGLWGVGFWAAPSLIAGIVFPEIVNMSLPIGFLLVPFIVGLLIHKMTGGVFAFILAKGYSVLNIYKAKARIGLGAVYGLGIFGVSWFVLLPMANPALLVLNPYVFATTHMMFGIILGKLTTV